MFKSNTIFNSLFNNNINNNHQTIHDTNNNNLFTRLNFQITEEMDKNKLLDSGYYDELLKSNKIKLGTNYTILEDKRKKQLEYLEIHDTILNSIETECLIEVFEINDFIINQINDDTFPKKMINILENKKNERISELKNMFDTIKKRINTEKISLNLKEDSEIHINIKNEICFSLETKKKLDILRVARHKYVSEYENMLKEIKNISNLVEYNNFDKEKIKLYPDDLKNDLLDSLNQKEKFIKIYDELTNINEWNYDLLEKLENHYKNIILTFKIKKEYEILNSLREIELKQTKIFINYEKRINNEIIFEDLIRNDRKSITYDIKNNADIIQQQKNVLIDKIINDKINKHMNELYDKLSILIDKKTFFSIHKTNIVHLILHRLKQEYLNNRDIKTIFEKFMKEELEDAINDYVLKSNFYNLDKNKLLENEKNWKKLITSNKFIISNYDLYKKYLNYKLNDNITIDHSERFAKSRRVNNARQKIHSKFTEYNDNFYDYLLDEMRIHYKDKEKYKNNGFFQNEIKILNDEFLSKFGYKISEIEKFRTDILNGFLD
jgi:hypothetical protein